MTLHELAEEALLRLRIEMRPMIPCQGLSWNVGEFALAHVRISNYAGAPLREIDVKPWLIGDAAEFVASSPSWDGRGAFRQSLEPGEIWECYPAFLRGVSAGSFQLAVLTSAEVIPWGNAPWAAGDYSVLPAP